MATKIDLSDVTFLIPVRIDSIHRLENLMAVVSFLKRNFAANFHLFEVATLNNNILTKLLPKTVTITFIEDHDPVFHRTYYANIFLKQVETPIVGIWDADVLVTREQVEESVFLIRKNEAQFVLPYNGRFFDTTMLIRELYLKQKRFSILKKNESKMVSLYEPEPVGGVIFASTNAYKNSGMENEYFYGWGHHDGERMNRWEILGYEIARVEGCIYHLSHYRSLNSKYHSKRQKELKMAAVERLGLMSKEEMQREVKSWE